MRVTSAFPQLAAKFRPSAFGIIQSEWWRSRRHATTPRSRANARASALHRSSSAIGRACHVLRSRSVVKPAEQVDHARGLDGESSPGGLGRFEPALEAKTLQHRRRFEEALSREIRGRALQRVRRRADPLGIGANDCRYDGGKPQGTVVQKNSNDFDEQLLVASEPLHQGIAIDGRPGRCRPDRRRARWSDRDGVWLTASACAEATRAISGSIGFNKVLIQRRGSGHGRPSSRARSATMRCGRR